MKQYSVLDAPFKDDVALFNKLYRIGDIFIVEDDFGNKTDRKLTSKAWMVSGSPVANFEGISGGYSINRVKLKQKTTWQE